MSDNSPEGSAGNIGFRAQIDFLARPDQAADPAWEEHVKTVLGGLGELAGVQVVSVHLDEAAPASQSRELFRDEDLHPYTPGLSIPVEELLCASKAGPDRAFATRISNAFRRSGLDRARDILAYGKMLPGDIRNVGEESITIVEDALNRLGFDWKIKPEISYLAKIFVSSDDVPLSVVLDLTFSHSRSVGDIRSVSRDNLAMLFKKVKSGSRYPNPDYEYEPDYNRADDITARINTFVEQFDHEKQRANP